MSKRDIDIFLKKISSDKNLIEYTLVKCNKMFKVVSDDFELKKIKEKLIKFYKNDHVYCDIVNNITEYDKDFSNADYMVSGHRSYKIYGVNCGSSYFGDNEGNGDYNVHLEDVEINELTNLSNLYDKIYDCMDDEDALYTKKQLKKLFPKHKQYIKQIVNVIGDIVMHT
jgi:hypothetical protein